MTWAEYVHVVALAVLLTTSVSAGEFAGYVVDVHDGDGFTLEQADGHFQRVRLCGIDSPESWCPRYDEAAKTLGKLVLGRSVRCRQVGSGTVCDGRSRPTSGNRIVAQCFVGSSERDVASVLVEQGLACDWTRFSGGYYSARGKGRACPVHHRSTCQAAAMPR